LAKIGEGEVTSTMCDMLNKKRWLSRAFPIPLSGAAAVALLKIHQHYALF